MRSLISFMTILMRHAFVRKRSCRLTIAVCVDRQCYAALGRAKVCCPHSIVSNLRVENRCIYCTVQGNAGGVVYILKSGTSSPHILNT